MLPGKLPSVVAAALTLLLSSRAHGAESRMLEDLECPDAKDQCWAMLFIEEECRPAFVEIPDGVGISPDLGFGLIEAHVPPSRFNDIRRRYVEWLKEFQAKNPTEFDELERRYGEQQKRTLTSRHCEIAGALQSPERDAMYAAMMFLKRHGGPGRQPAANTREQLQVDAGKNLRWWSQQSKETQEQINLEFPKYLNTRSAYFLPDTTRTFRRTVKAAAKP